MSGRSRSKTSCKHWRYVKPHSYFSYYMYTIHSIPSLQVKRTLLEKGEATLRPNLAATATVLKPPALPIKRPQLHALITADDPFQTPPSQRVPGPGFPFAGGNNSKPTTTTTAANLDAIQTTTTATERGIDSAITTTGPKAAALTAQGLDISANVKERRDPLARLLGGADNRKPPPLSTTLTITKNSTVDEDDVRGASTTSVDLPPWRTSAHAVPKDAFTINGGGGSGSGGSSQLAGVQKKKQHQQHQQRLGFGSRSRPRQGSSRLGPGNANNNNAVLLTAAAAAGDCGGRIKSAAAAPLPILKVQQPKHVRTFTTTTAAATTTATTPRLASVEPSFSNHKLPLPREQQQQDGEDDLDTMLAATEEKSSSHPSAPMMVNNSPEKEKEEKVDGDEEEEATPTWQLEETRPTPIGERTQDPLAPPSRYLTEFTGKDNYNRGGAAAAVVAPSTEKILKRRRRRRRNRGGGGGDAFESIPATPAGLFDISETGPGVVGDAAAAVVVVGGESQRDGINGGGRSADHHFKGENNNGEAFEGEGPILSASRLKQIFGSAIAEGLTQGDDDDDDDDDDGGDGVSNPLLLGQSPSSLVKRSGGDDGGGDGMLGRLEESLGKTAMGGGGTAAAEVTPVGGTVLSESAKVGGVLKSCNDGLLSTGAINRKGIETTVATAVNQHRRQKQQFPLSTQKLADLLAADMVPETAVDAMDLLPYHLTPSAVAAADAAAADDAVATTTTTRNTTTQKEEQQQHVQEPVTVARQVPALRSAAAAAAAAAATTSGGGGGGGHPSTTHPSTARRSLPPHTALPTLRPFSSCFSSIPGSTDRRLRFPPLQIHHNNNYPHHHPHHLLNPINGNHFSFTPVPLAAPLADTYTPGGALRPPGAPAALPLLHPLKDIHQASPSASLKSAYNMRAPTLPLAAASESDAPVSFRLQLSRPALAVVLSPDKQYMAVVLGSHADWEPSEILVFAISLERASQQADPALDDDGDGEERHQTTTTIDNNDNKDTTTTTDTTAAARVVASLAVQRSRHAEGLPITPSSLALTSTRRGDPVLLLSAVYELTDGPASVGRPTMHVVPCSGYDGGDVDCGAGALGVESDYPFFSLAVVDSNTVVTAGGGNVGGGAAVIEFDPLWRSYTWKKSLPSAAPLVVDDGGGAAVDNGGKKSSSSSSPGTAVGSDKNCVNAGDDQIEMMQPPLLDDICSLMMVTATTTTTTPTATAAATRQPKQHVVTALTATGAMTAWNYTARECTASGVNTQYAVRAVVPITTSILSTSFTTTQMHQQQQQCFVALLQRRDSPIGETSVAVATFSSSLSPSSSSTPNFLILGDPLQIPSSASSMVTSIGALGENSIVLGCGDGGVRVWNIQSGDCSSSMDVCNGAAVTCIAASGDVVVITSIAGDCVVIEKQELLLQGLV